MKTRQSLTMPKLIGTDQDKINGIKFWSDVVSLLRSINQTITVVENQKTILTSMKNLTERETMDPQLVENEHALSTPELIGDDQEKIAGIKFWSDVISLIRSLNTIFVSYDNKKAIIAAFKKELDLLEIELDNETSHPSQGGMGIPSTDQTLDRGHVNVVDLTNPQEVAATTTVGKKAPTFEDLEKLRRAAGSGVWDKNYGPIVRKKK